MDSSDKKNVFKAVELTKDKPASPGGKTEITPTKEGQEAKAEPKVNPKGPERKLAKIFKRAKLIASKGSTVGSPTGATAKPTSAKPGGTVKSQQQQQSPTEVVNNDPPIPAATKPATTGKTSERPSSPAKQADDLRRQAHYRPGCYKGAPPLTKEAGKTVSPAEKSEKSNKSAKADKK